MIEKKTIYCFGGLFGWFLCLWTVCHIMCICYDQTSQIFVNLVKNNRPNTLSYLLRYCLSGEKLTALQYQMCYIFLLSVVHNFQLTSSYIHVIQKVLADKISLLHNCYHRHCLVSLMMASPLEWYVPWNSVIHMLCS